MQQHWGVPHTLDAEVAERNPTFLSREPGALVWLACPTDLAGVACLQRALPPPRTAYIWLPTRLSCTALRLIRPPGARPALGVRRTGVRATAAAATPCKNWTTQERSWLLLPVEIY